MKMITAVHHLHAVFGIRGRSAESALEVKHFIIILTFYILTIILIIINYNYL